MLLDIEYL